MADERVVPGQTATLNVMKHIARYNLAMADCANKTVLDIACGTGYGSQLLSWVANMVVGVDIDEQSIEHAKKNYKRPYFEQSDFFDYEKDFFDTVICFETIEHLEDISRVSDKVRQWVKPNGLFVFSVPLNENKGWNEHHKHTFTIDQAQKLFPDIKTDVEMVQHGVNFLPTDSPYAKLKMSYYVCFKRI